MARTTSEFIEKARGIHGDKYDYSRSVYVNAKTKVEIICPEHGSFMQEPDKHLNGRCGCPACSGNVRMTREGFIEKARAIHGDKYDYSAVVYRGNKAKVSVICPEHGMFEQTPTNHLSGRGCAKCANNVRSDTEAFIAKARAVHGDKYDYSQVAYRKNRLPVTIVCPEHGPFQQNPYSHLSGCGCPVCGNIVRHSGRDEVAIRQKATQTFMVRYGVPNPMLDPEIRKRQKDKMASDEVNEKRNATKRRNGSFNTSLPEHRLGMMLKEIFGEDDVLQQHSSDAYPFMCDFYIPSRDLYIELNAHWSHGGHWYGEHDAETVARWRAKSRYHGNAGDTFSVRDVAKRDAAKRSRLNYVVFWKADLSDAQKWIELGCPDGQDWDKEYSWLS